MIDFPIKETPDHRRNSLRRLAGYYNILEEIESVSGTVCKDDYSKRKGHFGRLISLVEEMARQESEYQAKL